MLLRFAVANHGSIKERQEISFVASSLKDEPRGLIPVQGMRDVQSVLPAALIYGANASGKSQFIDAIVFLRHWVLHSQEQKRLDNDFQLNPFALDPAYRAKPSVFEVDFLAAGVHHEYGCALLDGQVEEEWLYRFPFQRKQLLFERDGAQYRFGRSLKGEKGIVKALARSDSLFLSAAYTHDYAELKSVTRFFSSISSKTQLSAPDRLFRRRNDKVDKRVLRVLRQIDTGIIGHRSKQSQESEDEWDLWHKMQSFLVKELDIDIEKLRAIQEKFFEIEFAHDGNGDPPVYLNFAQESAGTKRLVSLLTAMFKSLDAGTVYILDELDVSVHTRVCELLLDLYNSPQTNAKGAQLLTTTHNAHLLMVKDLLRRDQIWLMEKDKAGATQLQPLSDFRIPRDFNISKSYLEGQLGGIPFAGRVADLLPFPDGP